MIDIKQYIQNIENMLPFEGATIPNDLCKGFNELSSHNQLIYFQAIQFLGCSELKYSGVSESDKISKLEREQAFRLMLLYLGIPIEPKWSSSVLERFWVSALSIPQAELDEVFLSYSNLIKNKDYKIINVFVNFTRDFVRIGHSVAKYQFPDSIRTFDGNLQQLIDLSELNLHNSYLLAFLGQIFQVEYTIDTVIAILIATINSSYWEEISLMLSDNIINGAGNQKLINWANQLDSESKRRQILELAGTNS